MNILVLHASLNTDKPDATGAFIPEAINFDKFRTSKGDVVQVIPYNNNLPKTKRFEEFKKLIEGANNFDAFVYLGHGLRTGLPSAGVTQANRKEFTDLLAKKALSKKKMIVTLYACSAGETTTAQPAGEGGFADKMRDDFVAKGFTDGWIDAHTVAAHATQNPYLRRFYLSKEQEAQGGSWLVAPGSPEFAVWRKRLNEKWKTDPFRFEFPFMNAADVLAGCKK